MFNFKKLLKKKLFYTKRIINGREVTVPRFFRVSPDLFYDENWMLEILKVLLPLKEGVFVDIGVNLGQTLTKVKSINLQQEYIGFECNPLCYYYAQELVRINAFPSALLVPVGVSNKTGILTLYSDYVTDSASSLVPGYRESEKYSMKQFVPVFEGDYLINFLKPKNISIIKVDVEGGELEVIEGLTKNMEHYRPIFLCEILPAEDTKGDVRRLRKERKDKILRHILSRQYVIYELPREGKIVKLDANRLAMSENFRNHLFLPREDVEKIEKALKENQLL